MGTQDSGACGDVRQVPGGRAYPEVTGCRGFCEPGVASCPIPDVCDLREHENPRTVTVSLADRWADEHERIRDEMLALLKQIPARHQIAYQKEASKWHARMKLAHRLLKELRPKATDEQRQRIDAEINRP